VALYRCGSDFTVRDRQCFDLLRPHLVHLHRRAELTSRTRRDLALMARGVETLDHALVVVRDGRIRRMTPRGEWWLRTYFDRLPAPDRLPERLSQWVQWHDRVRPRVDGRPPAQPSLVVERPERRLTVRLMSEPPDHVLLLRETATRLKPAELLGLGLSRREAEVLAWAAGGKTNPAIAALLHISPRTVQTHLEGVYRKLGVDTRTAAAARALETMHQVAAGA
jgi:DNA-binding CsgD family transcriptional regulator